MVKIILAQTWHQLKSAVGNAKDETGLRQSKNLTESSTQMYHCVSKDNTCNSIKNTPCQCQHIVQQYA